MSQERMPKILKTMWPKYKWMPIETGYERIYKCVASPYEISVEARGGNIYLTLSRYYTNPDMPVSVVGASVGVSAEAVRRAFLEAKLAWMLLHKVDVDPIQALSSDLEDDQEYFKKLFDSEIRAYSINNALDSEV